MDEDGPVLVVNLNWRLDCFILIEVALQTEHLDHPALDRVSMMCVIRSCYVIAELDSAIIIASDFRCKDPVVKQVQEVCLEVTIAAQ